MVCFLVFPVLLVSKIVNYIIFAFDGLLTASGFREGLKKVAQSLQDWVKNGPMSPGLGKNGPNYPIFGKNGPKSPGLCKNGPKSPGLGET
jgi:hypothetical protein